MTKELDVQKNTVGRLLPKVKAAAGKMAEQMADCKTKPKLSKLDAESRGGNNPATRTMCQPGALSGRLGSPMRAGPTSSGPDDAAPSVAKATTTAATTTQPAAGVVSATAAEPQPSFGPSAGTGFPTPAAAAGFKPQGLAFSPPASTGRVPQLRPRRRGQGKG